MYVIKANFRGVFPTFFKVTMCCGTYTYDPVDKIDKDTLFDNEKDAKYHADRLKNYFEKHDMTAYEEIRVCPVDIVVQDVSVATEVKA